MDTDEFSANDGDRSPNNCKVEIGEATADNVDTIFVVPKKNPRFKLPYDFSYSEMEIVFQ